MLSNQSVFHALDVQQLRVLAKEQEIEPEDFWGTGKLIEEI